MGRSAQAAGFLRNRRNIFPKSGFSGANMIHSFPRYILNLVLTALAVVFTLPGRLSAAPVTDHPRLLIRSSDLPALRARMNANNDVWVAFKSQIVDKALRDWKCSATSAYVINDNGTPNDPSDDWGQWVRTSFTDENGITHTPADSDWNQKWANQAERPAAPEGHFVIVDEHQFAVASRQNIDLYAIDAKSGALKWQYNDHPDQIVGFSRNRGVAVLDGKVFVATLAGHIVALDAETGKKAWDKLEVESPKDSYFTMQPVPYSSRCPIRACC